MADLITVENLINLVMLCFLQAVLGFDNLLYISIESQRAPVAKQKICPPLGHFDRRRPARRAAVHNDPTH